MRILLVTILITVLSGCSNSITSCDEYAAEVRSLIDGGASTERLESFLEDTQEQVAELIAEDPDAAGPCVEAALEVVFVVGFDELESLLDG